MFTLQNIADSIVLGYKVFTLNFGLNGDPTKPERCYFRFAHLYVNDKTNPVTKDPGFVTNPVKYPLSVSVSRDDR